MTEQNISTLIAISAFTKVFTKTIMMPILFKWSTKRKYILSTTILGIIHATSIALIPKNKTTTYISFILAAIALLSKAILTSEITKNTNQIHQSKTQGIISATIAFAECLGPFTLNQISKLIPMSTHPTYIFFIGTIIYMAQAIVMSLHHETIQTKDDHQQHTQPLLGSTEDTNSDDVENHPTTSTL
jgi:hypothetical protein